MLNYILTLYAPVQGLQRDNSNYAGMLRGSRPASAHTTAASAARRPPAPHPRRVKHRISYYSRSALLECMMHWDNIGALR